MEALLQFFFPSRCAGCGRYGDAGLCEICRGNLAPAARMFRFSGIRDGISLGDYAPPLRSAVIQLKFHHQRGLGKTLGTLLGERIAQRAWPIDIVAPVPLSPASRRERGFNQAKILAVNAARRLALPCLDILRVIRPVSHQVKLEKKERRENVRGAFALKSQIALAGKIILLVDDVVTTGATISECALVMKGCGAADVYAACVALDSLETRK